MTPTYLILISLAAIFIQVAVKSYEKRTGVSVWKKLKLESVYHFLEDVATAIQYKLHRFDAKNIATYARNTWIVLKQFYVALQRVTTEKVAQAGRMVPQDHGNKAASFYLKDIKEHKDQVLENVDEEELEREVVDETAEEQVQIAEEDK